MAEGLSRTRTIIENLTRRDSGYLRLLIVFLFSCVGIVALNFSYLLLIKGVYGEFTIMVENLEGITLVLSSVAPGVFMILAAVVILAYGLPKTLKSMMQ